MYQRSYDCDAPECVRKLTYGPHRLNTSLTAWLLTGFLFAQLFCLGPVHGFVGLVAAPLIDGWWDRGNKWVQGISGIQGILAGYLALAYFLGAPWWHTFMGVGIFLEFPKSIIEDLYNNPLGPYRTDHKGHMLTLATGFAVGFLMIKVLGFGFGGLVKRHFLTYVWEFGLTVVMLFLFALIPTFHGLAAGRDWRPPT